MSKIVGIDYANGGKAAVYVKSVDGTQKFVIERHGQWVKADTYRDEDGYICYEYRCSLCDRIVDELESYCPNCGARMAGNYD